MRIATSRSTGETCRRQSSIVRFWPHSWLGSPWAENRRWVEDRRWRGSFEMSTWSVDFHKLHGIEKLTEPMRKSSATSAKSRQSIIRASPPRAPRANPSRRAVLPSTNRTMAKSAPRRADQPSTLGRPIHRYTKDRPAHSRIEDRPGTTKPSPSATSRVGRKGEPPRRKELCPRSQSQA
jgi:hypothetical protein